MAITIMTKNLEPGFVQIESTDKYEHKRYYKVPNKNAKLFASDLKKQDKNLNLYSNISFFAAIFAGVFGAAHFTKKIESRLKQFLIQSAAGVGAATLSMLCFNMYANNEEQNLLKVNGAKEIYYKI